MRNIRLSGQLSVAFFCAAIFTLTWDRILTLDIAGFTLRLSQLLFGCSFCLVLYFQRKAIVSSLSTCRSGFCLTIGALASYYLLAAPWSHFPLKSELYSVWLFFNLASILLCALMLPRKGLLEAFIFTLAAAAAFHSFVILIDQAAFQFGYVNGFWGFNQNEISKMNISRPHAFSFEPSYIANFLALSLIFTVPPLLKYGWRTITYAGLVTFAIIASTSRSGLAALLTGFALVFVGYGVKQRRVPWRALLLAALTLALGISFFIVTTPREQLSKINETLVTSLAGGTDGSGSERLRTHGYALEIAKRTHWLGAGLGASFKFQQDFKEVYETQRFGKFERKSYGYELIPSTWGQLLAEGGIPAILLYLLAGLFIIRSLSRKWLSNGTFLELAALASCCIWFVGISFWLGNLARGDVWIWYALWSLVATGSFAQEAFVAVKDA